MVEARVALLPVRRHAGVAAVAAVAVGIALYLLVLGPPAPPGFIRDEASVSYNAYTLSQNLHDQNHGLLPLYIKSFGDYKSPLFVYLLAAVFRVTGPGKTAAIATAGVVVAAAVLLLGLLAWRRTRSLFAAGGTILLAGLTPWLGDLGRVVFDTSIEPLLIVLVLLALDWAYRSERGALARGIPLGLALAGLAYSYAGGRLVSPLWAAALLVFAGRGRWRWLVTTWAVYVVAMVPLAVYSASHTGALSARYEATTFVTHGMSAATIVRDFLSNYVHDANPWHWLVTGDPRPYIHVGASPQLFVVPVLLAVAGVVIVVRRERGDRFWWFVAAALLLAPTAAAITEDRHYSLRLLPLPILVVVLAIPAVHALGRAAARDWPARFVLAGAVVLLAVQVVTAHRNYDLNNPGRAAAFEHDVPTLLRQAFAGDRTVYIDHDDIYAQTHALWYAVTHDVPTSRVSILPDGGMPPVGSMVFGRLQACDYECTHLAEADTYWIARAVGPKKT